MLRLFLWALCGLVTSAQADGMDTLAQFLKSTRSARADFTQEVSSPPKDGQLTRKKISSGSFAFARPLHFRLDYKKPFAQAIVADGKTLWLFDPELKQVSTRPQAQALAATPVAVFALANDVASLQKEFQLQVLPDALGLQWVQATPLSKEASLQSMRLGLRTDSAGVVLVRLDVNDTFGQQSVLQFEHIEINPKNLLHADFAFIPPKGVDVIQP